MSRARNRREVLTGAAVGLAAATVPRSASAADAGPPRGRVDFHTHFVPDVYRSTLAEAGIRGIGSVPFPAWNLDQQFEHMEGLGIARAILSIPDINFGSDALTVRLARETNDLLVRLKGDHPGRISGFAALPMPDVPAALKELDRIEGSGLEGVMLLTNYGGKYLSHADFAPLLEELNRRRAIVFLHPSLPTMADSLGLALPPPILEFVFDTTRCIADMIFTGTFDKYPHVDWVLSHLGGALPFLAWRLAMIEHSPRDAYAAFRARGRTVQSYLRKLYYDTAVSAGPAGLAATLEVVPPSQIVFGSDVPFLPYNYAQRTAAALDAYEGLSKADHGLVASGNAARLLAGRAL